MTPQDWKEVEGRLNSLYLRVELMCDEYEVVLMLQRISQMKNAIMIYVNGVMNMKWLLEECEERRRFMRPVKKRLYTQKQRAALKKVGKKLRKKYNLPDPDASTTVYYPYWTSFKALQRHLIKQNNSIELIEE